MNANKYHLHPADGGCARSKSRFALILSRTKFADTLSSQVCTVCARNIQVEKHLYRTETRTGGSLGDFYATDQHAAHQIARRVFGDSVVAVKRVEQP